MSFLPPNENIAEKKICRLSGKEFFVTDKDLEFYDKVSPIFGGEKYSIPSPTLCPEERMRRRLSFRNERKLYHAKCAKTGNQIISIYSHDKEYIVYDPKVWNSDDWDPHEFRSQFDFSRPFFAQFNEFLKQTPKPALANGFGENSDYCNQCYYLKDCYLCFCTDYSEDCEYLYGSFGSKNCFDCLNVEKCEYCYECVGSANCSNCQHSRDCRDSRDMLFCFDCSSCHDCFGCTNLRNKSHYFFNEELSPEVYKKRLEEYKNASEKIQNPILGRVRNMMQSALYRDTKNIACESCTGDFLHGCKNSYECFEGREILESKYLSLAPAGTDFSYDGTGMKGAWNNEGVSIDGNNILFSAYIYSGNANVLYSHFCANAGHDLFGCSSLKKADHCILNTPYSVQEYETLCGKIIDHMRNTGEWGEFFPTEISPFGYDETVANEHFPLTEKEVKNMPRFEEWKLRETPFLKGDVRTSGQGDLLGINQNKSSPLRDAQGTSFKKEVTGKGWKWKGEEETSSYHGPFYEPLNIAEYNEKKVGYEIAQKNIDSVIGGILKCEITGKPFKIIKQELAFYIEHGIPLPRKHPDERYQERLRLKNPRKLWERNCVECKKSMITSYSSERPEKVVCEECYRKLVY